MHTYAQKWNVEFWFSTEIYAHMLTSTSIYFICIQSSMIGMSSGKKGSEYIEQHKRLTGLQQILEKDREKTIKNKNQK